MSTRQHTSHTAKDRQPGDTQLGETTFDDWYDTPVFESEPDERLEQLAMSRRAPVRLVGNALLRLAPAPVETGGAEAAGAEAAVDDGGPSWSELETSWPATSRRARIGRFLDRWAEMETAAQARLEQLILPKRWQG